MDILNQFGVEPVLLAAQVVNFLILLFILKRFLYKPLLKVLEERKVKIAESLKNAEEIEKKLLETNQEYEKILAQALKESEKILDQSKQAGVRIMEDSKETAAEIIRRATEQALELKKVEMVRMEEEVKKHIGSLVALGLEKVIGKSFTGKKEKEMIEKEIRNLS